MYFHHNLLGRCLKAMMLCLLMVCTLGLRAQAPITSVHGTVEDEFGPLMSATVCEIDGNDRVISSCLTDMNGNFSMKIINSKDRLRIQYVGMKPVVLPINKATLNIIMESNTVLEEVTVKSERRSMSSAITVPERQVAVSKQTISTEDFEGLAVTTIDEALQGRLAGLDIISNSGNLGSGSSMKSRGGGGSLSGVTGNDILIVVDGNIWDVDMSNFDLSNSNDEQFAELLNISTDDIASISFLKDATATAPYGSRGSNGVIELTTKRGVMGKPTISYKFMLSGIYQPEGMKLLNGDDYTMMLKEAYFNPRQDDNASNIPEISYDPNFSEYEQYNNNTDWRKAVTQFGIQQQHSLNLTGGGEKALFRISASFDDQENSIIEQHLNRLTSRTNLDYVVSRRIRVQTNFSMTYTKNNRNSDNLLGIAQRKMPNMSIYEQDPVTGENTNRYYNMLQSGPNIGSEIFKDDQRNLVNPVASAHLAKNEETSFNLSPELVLNYELLGLEPDSHRLSWRGQLYMNIFNLYTDKFYPSELVTTDWHSGHNTSSAYSKKSFSLTTKHTFLFRPYVGEGRNAQAEARFELTSGHNTDQTTSGSGLPSGGIVSPDAGGKNTGLSSSYSEWRSLFMFTRLHYSWAEERYTVSGAVSFEGTTKFGKDKRWGVSPSVALRWNVIDEPFMQPLKSWLSMFSIRPGWGLKRRGPNADYLYTSRYGSTSSYLDMNAMYPQNLLLSNMQWEKSNEYNLGFDIHFFKDERLKLKIDLYNNRIQDMLMGGYRIPSNTGFSTVAIRNTGKSRQSGWEFFVNSDGMVRKGKFRLDVNANFGNNRSEILEMDESILKAENKNFNNSNAEILTRVQVHNPLGSIYGFRSKGVYQYEYETFAALSPEAQADFIRDGKTAPVAMAADGSVIYNEKGEPVRMMFAYTNDGNGRNYTFRGGDAIYEDVNHDGNINSLDIVYLGSSLPSLIGGFGFTASYDRWRFTTQFTYRLGFKIVNLARLRAESMSGNDNQSQAVNYRWRKEGDITTIPRAMYGATSNYNTLISDRFVEDGDYLRMGSATLSYTMKNQWLSQIGVKRISSYLTVFNPFVLTRYTGVDPDVSAWRYSPAIDDSKTPRSRQFTLGVTFDF